MAYKRPASGPKAEARAERKRVAEESAHPKKKLRDASFTERQLSQKIQALVLDGLDKKTLFQFPLQPNGQALGEVAITQSEGKRA